MNFIKATIFVMIFSLSLAKSYLRDDEKLSRLRSENEMENSQRLVDDDVPVVKPDNINDVPERFIYQAILATPIPQPFYTAINSTNSTFEIFTTTPMSRTSINGSTNPLNQTTSTTPAHPPTPPPTSPPTPPPPGEGQLEDCLLGNSDTKIKWVDGDGRLIHQNNCSKDLSYQYKKDILELEIANIIEDIHSTVNGVVCLMNLSLAYNNFHCLPIDLISNLSDSLERLSLAGNDFSNGANDSFPSMSKLKELDLRNCQIKVLNEKLLRNLTALEHLYISNNDIAVINIRAFPLKLIEIDLSYNNLHPNDQTLLRIERNIFSALNNLITLDFSHSKLDTPDFLSNLPSSLQQLGLCYTYVPIELSLNATSLNLKKLDISGNVFVHSVSKRNLFRSLSNSLEVLHVRRSKVQLLDWAESLNNLKHLDLYDNIIFEIDNRTFQFMKDLRFLNLGSNFIDSWYQRVFKENQNLEILLLSDNRLTTITKVMEDDFENVKVLALGGNDKFSCTCELQEYMEKIFDATMNADLLYYENFVNNISLTESDIISRKYRNYYEMLERSVNTLKSSPLQSESRHNLIMRSRVMSVTQIEDLETVLMDFHEENYNCHNNALRVRQLIHNISLCEPSTTELDEIPLYNVGKNKTLMALFISFPTIIAISILSIIIYWKRWYIKYFYVMCKNSLILTFMDDHDDQKDVIVNGLDEENVETFVYDVFVSYSDRNRQWVIDELIPNIEQRESINVCLHERDFQVGYGILDNIVSSMDRSRCLLLLISEDFLASQWCQFEMNLAQHRLLETRRDKLILVFLEDISKQKQSKTLKYLMRTKTYLKWPLDDNVDDRKLFWKRLKKSIIDSKWETENYGSSA